VLIRNGSTPPPIMMMTLPLQAFNFVQSNDLMYRTALDVTGFDLPLYASARSNDERRESLTNILVSTAVAFLFAPLYVLGFNKLMANQLLPDKNRGFFHLNWSHLDDKSGRTAVKRLKELDARLQTRLTDGNWFDKLKPIQHQLQETRGQFKQAISTLEAQPSVLKSVGNAKLWVLMADLALTAGLVNLTDPLAMWITKKLSHHDRFTGSEAYLSDTELEKLQHVNTQKPPATTQKKTTTAKASRVTPLKIGLHIGLSLLPALSVLAIHRGIGSLQQKGNVVPAWLLNSRNSLDYSNALYMSIGGLFTLFLANNLTHSLWARDQYERAEIFVKYGLILPSFCFGDHLFNGNIAKLTDKALAKAGHFEAGTFINTQHNTGWGAEPKFIQDVMEQVAQTEEDPKKVQHAGIIASAVFASGFIAHSLAMMGIFTLGNALTKRWITKDLSMLAPANQPPINHPYSLKPAPLTSNRMTTLAPA
jgi:hypothetical protein